MREKLSGTAKIMAATWIVVMLAGSVAMFMMLQPFACLFITPLESGGYLGDMADANPERAARFERCRGAFDAAAGLAMEKFKKATPGGQSGVRGHFFVDLRKGTMELLLQSTIDEEMDPVDLGKVSLSPREKKTLRELWGYAGKNLEDIYITAEQTTFHCGERIVYVQDGSIPKYQMKPDDNIDGMWVYSLGGGWYYVSTPR
jgi:hypothetical protein